MISIEVKHDFSKMYCELCNSNTIDHNLITMGNLAFFIDRCRLVPKLNEYKDKQDLLLLVASNIYLQAKSEKIGENLDFRMKRIIEKHELKQLRHFDILLDDYDFPQWFQRYIPLIEQDDIYQAMVDIILGNEKERRIKLEHFEKRIHHFSNAAKKSSQKWKYILPAIDALFEDDKERFLELLDFKI
ncbi:hypothetical protein NDS46_31170 (plasmid) [Paenibacillus thiaminolyticus]|uniref:hypothetical protein n=1 Tax=Paenibacillus thiaminolyticus TaxID=49283 RepID=UPI0023311362|nr:hypothetical protein [Paenibacillus thiaminolyticus]WCF11420.1 hypothetical protein NDS46_31170 [Paenibacillus thiaminolyticus]